jgi:hypothetical protein
MQLLEMGDEIQLLAIGYWLLAVGSVAHWTVFTL